MWWIYILGALTLLYAFGNSYITARDDEKFKMLLAMLQESKMYYAHKTVLYGFIMTIAFTIGVIGSVVFMPLIIIELLIGPLLKKLGVQDKLGALLGGKKK
jgi:hypothetical protein